MSICWPGRFETTTRSASKERNKPEPAKGREKFYHEAHVRGRYIQVDVSEVLSYSMRGGGAIYEGMRVGVRSWANGNASPRHSISGSAGHSVSLVPLSEHPSRRRYEWHQAAINSGIYHSCKLFSIRQLPRQKKPPSLSYSHRKVWSLSCACLFVHRSIGGSYGVCRHHFTWGRVPPTRYGSACISPSWQRHRRAY